MSVLNNRRFLRPLFCISLIILVTYLIVENFQVVNLNENRKDYQNAATATEKKTKLYTKDLGVVDMEPHEFLDLLIQPKQVIAAELNKIKEQRVAEAMIEPREAEMAPKENLDVEAEADAEQLQDLEPVPEMKVELTTITQRLETFLDCRSSELKMERAQLGSYWVARNLFVGEISRTLTCAESITYTTNGDYTFFDNVENVVERWLGPISFAIFAPGYDLNATLDAIQYIRNCLTKSDLIRDYVSFHVFFPNTHMPPYLPKTEDEAKAWKYDCTLPEPYLNVNRSVMYKTAKNLTYPINVARNIARKAVNTHFIFACDIELYPSPGFIQQFLEMIDSNHSVVSAETKRVFPLPVFELDAKVARLPATKNELLEMLKNKTAIPFHAHVCKNCHLVPEQASWLNATAENDELSVFSVGKRWGKFKYWEPFYVSDNREPYFDERVTWEGQANKRIQGYAMCLSDYEYHVLHPAFLVHSPGIKKYDSHSTRRAYAIEMSRFIKSKIEPEYRILYGQNKNCTT